MAIRTFLALDLDESIRQRLADVAASLPQQRSKIRWTPPENLHLTVKFLGNVAKRRAARVCELVEETCRAIAPLDFQVRGLRCIPAGGRVKMIWANVQEPTGKLQEAQGLLESALTSLRFPREKRQFVPHVTLARIKATEDSPGLRAAAARHAETDFGVQHAVEVVTYGSKLTPTGAVYDPLGRAPLAGADEG
jgi:2'-5' RNA ligase